MGNKHTEILVIFMAQVTLLHLMEGGHQCVFCFTLLLLSAKYGLLL